MKMHQYQFIFALSCCQLILCGSGIIIQTRRHPCQKYGMSIPHGNARFVKTFDTQNGLEVCEVWYCPVFWLEATLYRCQDLEEQRQKFGKPILISEEDDIMITQSCKSFGCVDEPTEVRLDKELRELHNAKLDPKNVRQKVRLLR